MTEEELRRANDICVNNAINITLYTGTSNAMFASNLLNRHQFDTVDKFRDTYVIQKLGSRNQKFNANYGPGIYLTDNVEEARNYGTSLIKFVCVATPFANLSGNFGTQFRKDAKIKGGGPQGVLAEPRLAALLLVAAGSTNYYTLRTPNGVAPSLYP